MNVFCFGQVDNTTTQKVQSPVAAVKPKLRAGVGNSAAAAGQYSTNNLSISLIKHLIV